MEGKYMQEKEKMLKGLLYDANYDDNLKKIGQLANCYVKNITG